jgi:hypothetical protein
MARFTTRIQLDGDPDEKTYEKLHEAMRNKGFSRFISSEEKVYHMPHAEYNREADVTIQVVRDDANTAVLSVWKNVQVLVTEGKRSWVGLKEATRSEVAAG